MKQLLRYTLLSVLAFLWTVDISAQTICPEQTSATNNLAFIRFQQSALKMDGETYFGDDIWLSAMYYNDETGFTCAGKVQYDRGETVILIVAGEDAFVKNGLIENTRMVIVAELEDGCILDSTQVFLNSGTEDSDSLYFSSDKLYEVKRIEVKKGDCLLTSTPEISTLTSLEIYPNPSDGIIQVDLNLGEVTNIQYSLMNLTGQIILKNQLEGQFIQEFIDLSHLPSSTYYLVFRQNGFVTTRKIVLMR